MSNIENIQLANTTYRGITRYYNKDWKIEAYNISRDSIKNKDYLDLDIKGHSIYFLYGEDENDNLKVYVGRSSETEKSIPIFTRLYRHKISTDESYKDIWSSAIAISFDELSFDEMRNLENYFYRAILNEIKLNKTEPDTKAYKYTDIQNKVEYIKAFVTSILSENVFKEEKKQETTKEVHALKYSEKEIRNQGKRLVDKEYEKITEVQTPLSKVDETLNSLPSYVWSPNYRFLNIACANGEYSKAIFNRLLSSDLYKGTPYEDIPARTLYIACNQLYGIALTDESLQSTLKNLNFPKANIIKPSFTSKGKEVDISYVLRRFNMMIRESIKIHNMDKTKEVLAYDKSLSIIGKCKEELMELGIEENSFSEYINKQFGVSEDMTFDVIVGNPPYQSETKSIYNEFIDAAIYMKPEHISMIVKNNWLVSDTLKPTRDNMINNGLKEITNYPVVGEVFSNISAAVTIFHMQKGYTGKTNFKEIRQGNIVSDYNTDLSKSIIISSNEIEQTLINKFSIISKDRNFGDLTYPSEPFRITTNGMVGRGNSAYKLNDFDTISAEHDIAVVYMDKSKQPYERYISMSDIPNRKELAPKYKVLSGRILTKDATVINNVQLLKPNTVCTSSWGLLYTSDTAEESLNVIKYIKTKTFRFLAKCLGEDGVIALSAYRFSLVPLQDFTSSSDINWSQSINNIDQQLYKKYNLTEEEIHYIESNIKPMS